MNNGQISSHPSRQQIHLCWVEGLLKFQLNENCAATLHVQPFADEVENGDETPGGIRLPIMVHH